MFLIGKGAALTKLQKDERVQQDILLFLENGVSKAEIKEARERPLVSLYGGKANNSLDQILLYKFHQKIASTNNVLQPEYLCPISDAAGLHSFRVNYQVQSWKETDNLNPKDLDRKKNGKLFPLYTSKDAGPASLLKLIRCCCKGGCSKRTSTYRRHNLKCSNTCGECKLKVYLV